MYKMNVCMYVCMYTSTVCMYTSTVCIHSACVLQFLPTVKKLYKYLKVILVCVRMYVCMYGDGFLVFM